MSVNASSRVRHVAALDGKVIAITGASSGIGEATARLLAAEGAKVSLAARREDRIEALASDIGDAALAVTTDVGDQQQAQAFIERTKDQLGGLDAVVNNAGVMLLGPVIMQQPEEWKRMIDANVYGVLWCTRAALPIFAEQGHGHFVNISSVAGRMATAGSAVYNLTKWGLNGFSEGLRQEMARANVRVTLVEPGVVMTELQGHNENPMVKEAIEKMNASIPEPLQAEDIARAILFAVSQPSHVAVNEVLVRPTGQTR
jgi:NADP-dependent 3-hydroxy acid dehydrogenase YdfG